MSNQDDLLMYDDEESIKFIKNYLPLDIKEKFTNDDICYIVDLIYEFYESDGVFNADDDEEIEIDENKIVDFVVKNAKKDQVADFDSEEVVFVIRGELEYCESIGMFE
ncbi:MAG: hypothetical protein ACRDD8_10395 [Bacteroidales bacterium]